MWALRLVFSKLCSDICPTKPDLILKKRKRNRKKNWDTAILRMGSYLTLTALIEIVYLKY